MCDCQWRDIETAPKDGDYILAICVGPGMSRVPTVIAYNIWEDCWADHPAPADKMPVRKVVHQPSHWMPLPAPPEPQTK